MSNPSRHTSHFPYQAIKSACMGELLNKLQPFALESPSRRPLVGAEKHLFNQRYHSWRDYTAALLGAYYDRLVQKGGEMTNIPKERFITDERENIKQEVLATLYDQIVEQGRPQMLAQQLIQGWSAQLAEFEVPQPLLLPAPIQRLPRPRALQRHEVPHQQVGKLVKIIQDAMLSDAELISKQSPDAPSWIMNQIPASDGMISPRRRLAMQYLAWELETEALLGDTMPIVERTLNRRRKMPLLPEGGTLTADQKQRWANGDGTSAKRVDEIENVIRSYANNAVRHVANMRSNPSHGAVGNPNRHILAVVKNTLGELQETASNLGRGVNINRPAAFFGR